MSGNARRPQKTRRLGNRRDKAGHQGGGGISIGPAQDAMLMLMER